MQQQQQQEAMSPQNLQLTISCQFGISAHSAHRPLFGILIDMSVEQWVE
jgi:hypothetical protein